MKRINYKSDFDFILRLTMCVNNADGTCARSDVGWPDFDWTAKFWTACKANSFTASRRGGVLTNCYNDNGQIHIVCNEPKIGKGVLWVEFHSELPNAIYPDSVQDLYEPQPLDIELVDGAGDCPKSFEVEMMLPYIMAEIPQFGAVEFVTGEAVYRMPVCGSPVERRENGADNYGYGGDNFVIGEWDL